MDYVYPVLMSDNQPIRPARSPLTSTHSSPSLVLPLSSRSSLFEAIQLNSQIGMDFGNVLESGSSYFSPIRQNRFDGIISKAPDENIKNECSLTPVRTVAGFGPWHSSSATHQTLSPPPPRRRGRAKPSVAKRPVDHGVDARRKVHNNNAARSRARLNAMLDNLWSTIPTKLRVRPKSESVLNHHLDREISRACQVEIAISYMQSMQENLKALLTDAVT